MGSSLVLCLAIWVLLGSVSAQEVRAVTGVQDPSRNSPVGRWKTMDDVTGKAKSVVVIWEENGKLFGRIQKIVDPDPDDPDPRCDDCTGEQKGKRVIGLRILWDLQGRRWLVWRLNTRSGERQNLQMPTLCGGRWEEAEGARIHRRLSAGPHAVLASRMRRLRRGAR